MIHKINQMKLKKFLAGALSAVLAVTACVMPWGGALELPLNELTASAYDIDNPCTDISGTCGENVSWVLKNGVLTISGAGNMTDFDEPGDSPFSHRKDIKSAVIKEGVTSIGNGAFWNCNKLKDISIPDSVTSIGENAFIVCHSLTSITIPDSVTSIESGTFGGCEELKSITIPDSVTSIGGSTFFGCWNLEKITILNPECEINNGYQTVFNRPNGNFDGTIYGYEGSTAQKYAEYWMRKFAAIGDTDNSGNVNVADLVLLQMYITNEDTLTDSKTADMNFDGEINVFDVILLKRMILED